MASVMVVLREGTAPEERELAGSPPEIDVGIAVGTPEVAGRSRGIPEPWSLLVPAVAVEACGADERVAGVAEACGADEREAGVGWAAAGSG